MTLQIEELHSIEDKQACIKKKYTEESIEKRKGGFRQRITKWFNKEYLLTIKNRDKYTKNVQRYRPEKKLENSRIPEGEPGKYENNNLEKWKIKEDYNSRTSLCKDK